MNSRFFHITKCFQYVFPILLVIILLQLASVAYAKLDFSATKGSLKDKILVTDFNYYREYFYKNRRILISKNKKNINLHFTKDNTYLILNQNQNKKTYELFKEEKNFKHNVFYKLNIDNTKQVGYYSKSKMKYFKTVEKNNDCNTSYKPLLEQMGSKDIVQKIGELQIINLMDKDTCDKISKDEIVIFKGALAQQFKTKSSSFATCFAKPEVQKIFEKDQFLQSSATAVLARFLNLVDKISNGEKPLKIKCDLEPNEKIQIASYNEKAEPVEISINFKNNKFASTVKKTGEDGKEKASNKTILNHELFHFGAQQYPIGKNQNCLDERIAQLFDKICLIADFNNAKFQSSADILNQCVSNEDSSATTLAYIQSDKVSTNLVDVETAGPATTSALVAATIQADQAQQNQIATNLQSTINPEIFTPVAQTDVSTLANATLHNKAGVDTAKNYGEQQSIVATPEVRESLDNVTSALGRATTGMTNGLNTAMAMAVNPAQAAAIRGNVDYSKQNVAYPVSQIVADKYSPDFDRPSLKIQVGGASTLASTSTGSAVKETSVKTTSNIISNTTAVELAATASTKNADSAAPNSQARANRQPASDSISGGTQSSRGIASVVGDGGGPAPTKPKSTELLNIENTSSQARTTATTFNQTNQQFNPPNAILDSPVLQNLTAFNQMTGSQYTLVAKQYNDPAFEIQLKRRGISITLVNEKNLPIRRLGATANMQHSFIDNGKTLIKVESKK